jgi:hypothetical protein
VRLDGSNHCSETRIDQCAVEIVGEFFGFKNSKETRTSSLDTNSFHIGKLSKSYYLTQKN